MKNKSLLTVIELTVMILFFALAAAVCVKGFVWADQRSMRNAVRDYAVLQAECAAELLKSSRGDLSGQEDFFPIANGWERSFTHAEAPCMLRVTLTQPQPLLGGADVWVTDASGQVLAELTVYWQEVSSHE